MSDLLDIDIHNVALGRSGKGGEMLVVDNFLYHYEDRGAVRNNEHRWVCNRRKQNRCRSRLVTCLVNDINGEPKHIVEKIVAGHTHERCDEADVKKIILRKQEADAEGAMSFLTRKKLGMIKPAKKRQSRTYEKRFKYDEDERVAGPDDDDVYSGDEEDDTTAEGNSFKYSHSDVIEMMEINPVHAETKLSVARVPSHPIKPTEQHGDDKLNSFAKDKIYMLHTKHGREMACVEGFLYRVEGKSKISETFRWECIRRDVSCEARIYTERLVMGSHKLKQGARAEMHSHEAYTPGKLKKLMNRHNISLVVSDNEDDDDYEEEWEFTEYIEPPPPKKDLKPASKSLAKPALKSPPKPKEPKFKVSHAHAAHLPVVKIELDPLAQLIKSKQAVVSVKKEKEADNLVEINKDYFFLPSAKGNKVLCLYNYIYHFDSRGPRGSKRCYWTCLLRRSKEYHCNARVITEDAPECQNGLRIVKVSGEHRHPDNKEDVEKRFNKSQNASTSASVITIVNPETLKVKTESIEPGQRSQPSTSASKISIDAHDIGEEHNDGGQQVPEEKLVKFDDIEKTMAIIIDESGECYAETPVEGEEVITISVQDEGSMDSVEPQSFIEEVVEEVEEDAVVVEDEGEDEGEGGDHQYHKAYMQGHEEEDNIDFDLSDFIRIAATHDTKEEFQAELARVTALKFSAATTKLQVKSARRPGRPSNNRSYNDDSNADGILNNMDINKVSRLRSAKGGFLLCIDGYIYYLKREQKNRTYWDCIKTKDRKVQCRARAATTIVDGKIKVTHVTNEHTHGISEYDLKRRLYNEVIGSKGVSKNVLKPMDVIKCNLADISTEYAEIIENAKSRQQDPRMVVIKNEFSPAKRPASVVDDAADLDHVSNYVYKKKKARAIMKLYAVSDGPPSLAVRMTLKALNIAHELHSVDYCAAEHMTEEYAKMNPQKEIPVLDDNGFFLSESIAIMQYLCDKYAPENEMYPKDPTARALVNHRLCFNMGFYYASISIHAMAPIFFDYPRNDMTLKKVNNVLSVFETYLRRSGTKYAAGDHVTIADFGLVSATLCLEGIGFDLTPYPLVKQWYETFKAEYPALWEIGKGGMQEIAEFEKNPPDLSQMNHPFHPTKKQKA